MNKRQREWAKAEGFVYRRGTGWVRPDGLRIEGTPSTLVRGQSTWWVMTLGGGSHPSMEVPA